MTSTSSKPPVFIIGPARSGTTILYRSLQQHSSFYPQKCPWGVELTESKAFTPGGCQFPAEPPDGDLALQFLLGNKQAYAKFVKSLWDVRLVQRLRLQHWIRCWHHRALRRYFRMAEQVRGYQRLLEKTPAHLYYTDEIKATFPQARFLITTRHPIDTFTSYRRRYQKELELGEGSAPDWMRLSPEDYVALFRNDNRSMHAVIDKYPQDCLLVQYESFVATPAAALRNILGFLDEPFEERCLVANESDKSNGKSDPHLYGTISAKTKDWREFIELDEARYIESALASEMAQQGYTAYAV